MAVRETLGIRFLPSQGTLIVECEKMGDWFEGIRLDRLSRVHSSRPMIGFHA